MLFFLYSVISGLNMLTLGEPCLCVCLCVCLSVTAFYLNTMGPISMKLGPYDLNKNLRWHISQILEMLPQWRHNGFFYVLRWGTLTPSIFVQFSSNWYMLLFKGNPNKMTELVVPKLVWMFQKETIRRNWLVNKVIHKNKH